MKNRVKFALVAGGVLAGLASFVPLTTYAECENKGENGSCSLTVTAIVSPSMTLDLVTGKDGVNMTGSAGEILTPGKIGAKVTSNTKYHINFKTKTNETAMIGTNGNAKSIQASTDIRAGNDAWAMRRSSTEAWQAITAEGVNLYTSEGTDDGTTEHLFDFGISTSQSLPADTYSVDLVVTAVSAAS